MYYTTISREFTEKNLSEEEQNQKIKQKKYLDKLESTVLRVLESN